MGDRTGISWTDATWNPWMGCTHVSEGCGNCYMFTAMRRYGRDPERVVRSKTKFKEPLGWKDGRLVFTCSWSDWFHRDADPWRDEAWDIIRRTPQHTYQILTKRTGRIPRHLPHDWGEGWPNVWLGATVEWQQVDYRIGQILDVPARVHFLSCEPLLGSLHIAGVLGPFGRAWIRTGRGPNDFRFSDKGIDWVICGGESGNPHRPVEVEHIRSVVRQCREAGVPVFVKQDSGQLPGLRGRIPEDLWIHEFPRIMVHA